MLLAWALLQSPLASAQADGTNGPVTALEVVLEAGVPVLWVGGGFTQAGGVSRPFLARYEINGNGWSGVPGGEPNGGVNVIKQLTLGGVPSVFVGGDFTSVDRSGLPDLAANRIVRWFNGEFSALGDGLSGFGSGGSDADVKALTLFAGDLIAGGRFRGADSFDSFGLARWDGGQWFALNDSRLANPGWADISPSGGGAVHALAEVGGQLLIGADRVLRLPRPECDGTPEPFGGGVIARWNGSSFSEIGVRDPNGSPNPSCGATGPTNNSGGALSVLSISDQPGGLVGGQFQVAIRQVFQSPFGPAVPQLNNVSRVDGDRFLSLPGGPEADQIGVLGPGGADVRAIVQAQGAQYIAGRFSSSGFLPPLTINNLARLDGNQWAPLVDADTGLQGTNGTVDAAAVDPITGDVYFGGQFTVAGGKSANRVVRWDGQRFHPLASPQRVLDGLLRGEPPPPAGKASTGSAGFVGEGVFVTGAVAGLDEQILKQSQLASVISPGLQKRFTVRVQNNTAQPSEVFIKLVKRPDAFVMFVEQSPSIELMDLRSSGFGDSVGTVAAGQFLDVPILMFAAEAAITNGFTPMQEQADLLISTTAQFEQADGEVRANDTVRLVALDDCNLNGVADLAEVLFGLGSAADQLDADSNRILDACEIDRNPQLDVNNNGVLDGVEGVENVVRELSFLEQQIVQLAETPLSVVVGDFNGDNRDDVITVEVAGNAQQTLRERQGGPDGLGEAHPVLALAEDQSTCIDEMVFDFDGDGIDDTLFLVCTLDEDGNRLAVQLFGRMSREQPPMARLLLDNFPLQPSDLRLLPLDKGPGMLPDLGFIVGGVQGPLMLQRMANLGLDGNNQLLGFAAPQVDLPNLGNQQNEAPLAALPMHLTQAAPNPADLLVQTTQRGLVVDNAAGVFTRRAFIPSRLDPDERPHNNPHRKPDGTRAVLDFNNDGIDDLAELVREVRELGGQLIQTEFVRLTDGRTLNPDGYSNPDAEPMVFEARFLTPLYDLSSDVVEGVCLDVVKASFGAPGAEIDALVVSAQVNGQRVEAFIARSALQPGFVGLPITPAGGRLGVAAAQITYADVDGDGFANAIRLDRQAAQISLFRAVGETVFKDGFE